MVYPSLSFSVGLRMTHKDISHLKTKITKGNIVNTVEKTGS